jgi:transposase
VNDLIRIGMDTSKSVFQLHGVGGGDERSVMRKKLRRRQVLDFFRRLPATKVGIEACGAAHHWAREIAALGHEVKLLAPQLVKPYLPRNKNDSRDAEAICEAMSRPQMRYVPVKTAEQQAALMLAGVRDQMVDRRTQVANSIRGYAAEFGLVAAKGHDKMQPLLARIAAAGEVPELAKQMFAMLAAEYAQVTSRVRELEARLRAWQQHNELSRRLAEVPSIGPVCAALMVMKVADPGAFRCGRDFAAWLGLTPKDHSTAGKQRLGVITRAGDEALRRLLAVGATAVIQQVKKGRSSHSTPWLVALVNRKPPKLAAVALANKTARIAWKLMVSGARYNPAYGFAPTAASVAPGTRRQGRAACGGGLRPALTARAPGAH